MITKQEILGVADETGLRPSVVEKDWVLGWLLAAINAAPNISRTWAFKGGTCLKKCYFETYRFSEDLDFTLQDVGHIDENFLQQQFTGIAEWLYEASGIIREVLAQKCAYKEIGVPVIEDMDAYKDAMESNWEPMLAHQLPALPSMESYWDALVEFFEWLEGRREPVRPALGVVSNSGDLYRPTYGHLGLRTRSGGSLEVIRFAAGNHLCVDLDYTANSGKRSSRIVEPYSLRRAGSGNILLYAVRADSGETRTYKINQINDASVTNQVFTPRYQVELSPASSVSPIPSTMGSSTNLGIPARSRNAVVRKSPVRKRPARKRAGISNSATHIYRCPICTKTFRRKSMNSKLNSHKNKNGRPCPGRTGYFEKTVY